MQTVRARPGVRLPQRRYRPARVPISKTVTPASVQQYGTVLYIVDVVNTGTADAFDIVITDVLPGNLALGTVTMPSVCTDSSGMNTVSVYCPQLDELTMMQITYEAQPQICPVTIQNQVAVTWTSLPGPIGTCASTPTLCTAGPSGAIDGERNGSTIHPPYRW